jgi:hypothetical protein
LKQPPFAKIKNMKLEHLGGEGYDWLSEDGFYQVNYDLPDGTHGEKDFTKLSEAIEFFDSLDCPRVFWGRGEIIDQYEFEAPTNNENDLPF